MWLESAATSRLNFLDWLNACGPAGWYGRTSPECIPALPNTLPITLTTVMDDGKMTQTKAMRSPVSWPDFKNSGMGSPTELWTLNTSEFHSAGVASSLSDILETGIVPPRYFLSAKACRGILRRAEKRGKTLPPRLSARTHGGGGLGTDFDCDGGLIAGTLSPGAHPGSYNGQDAYSGQLITAPLTQNPYADNESRESLLVTHALRADGFDASEDGTGRGTPLVPVAFVQNARDEIRLFNGDGQTVGALAAEPEAKQQCYVAFDCKASGRNGFGVGEVSPTLRSMGHKNTHQNAGGQVAVMTLAIRGRDGEPTLEIREDGTANAVLTPNGGRGGIGVGAVAIQKRAICENPDAGPDGVGVRDDDTSYSLEARTVPQAVMTPTMAVRRLTPHECERLQGFPDDYTKITAKTADGPRYKALGNSMAVPVMRWIGERIAMVESITERPKK